MMGRTKTKLPSIIKVPQGREHAEAKENDQKSREQRKVAYDKRKCAKVTEMKPGDKVLLAQKKTTTQPPFNPNPFIVVRTKGSQITAKRGDTIRFRNQAKFKLIKERPTYLLSQGVKYTMPNSYRIEDDDDDWYSLPKVGRQVMREIRISHSLHFLSTLNNKEEKERVEKTHQIRWKKKKTLMKKMAR